MNRCPLTYQALNEGQLYSAEGLKALSPQLNELKIFSYSAKEQRTLAEEQVTKISIQGMQPKLSAVLSIPEQGFVAVEKSGRYILKPQTERFALLPENEDLSMRLAALCGIEVPQHGLLRCADNTFTYFIRRMDRTGHKDKLPMEDFAQLSGRTRESKYESSTEQVLAIIQKYCTFPTLELASFFRRFLFNHLIGNEDMHLKNYSLITRNEKVELSPAYDLLNSTIVLQRANDETALPLNGKKRNLTKKDILVYLPQDRMQLPPKIIEQTLNDFRRSLSLWQTLIESSFLTDELKKKYWDVVSARTKRLEL